LSFGEENIISVNEIANAYGSNFPYRGIEKHLQMQTQVVDIFPSLEPGGFLM
tara:strand:- start:2264 stop:2419 length:156 start_codon:yes stop_codon:yes gene_type:complete